MASIEEISHQITDGEHATPQRINERQVPLVTAKNVRDGSMDYEDTDWVSYETAGKAWRRCRPIPGDILLVCVGATTGRLCILREPKDMVLVRSVALIRPDSSVYVDYLALTLRSPLSQKQIWEKVKVSAQPCLYINRIKSLSIPLPPLYEQRRIVAKVDDLMALCDQLEVAQAERERRRDRLTAASFHRLNNGANVEAFRDHANFCLAHISLFTTSSSQIQHLRQTLLQLAIRGLLVPQHPQDELAAEFLGERRLIPNSEPWKLPSGWAWSSFSLIGETLGGGTPSKAHPEFWKGTIPWVSPKDMKVDVIADSQDHISTAAVEQSAVKLIPTGSLLIVVRGMILAHSFPTASTAVPVTINQDMKAIVPFRADLISFLVLLTKGLKPEVLRLVLRSTHGTCKLLTDDLFSLPIPIPPLAEQRRMLAKVNELMAICDRLEATLSAKRSGTGRLLEAVLHFTLANQGTPRAELDGLEWNAAPSPLRSVLAT